ncbi:Anion exchange protein 3 [Branchiostoma belcheri]|nr:Anion exchange protein 3 [Branchiostoma belcheri]
MKEDPTVVQAEVGGAMAETTTSSSAPRQRHPSLQDQMNKVMNPVEKFPLLPTTSPLPSRSSPRVKQLHVDEDDYQDIAPPLAPAPLEDLIGTVRKDFPPKGLFIPEEKDIPKPTKEPKRPRVEPPREEETPRDVTTVTVEVESEDVGVETEEKAEPPKDRKASLVRTDSYETAVRSLPDLVVEAASVESLTTKLCKEPSVAPPSPAQSHEAPPSYHECVQEIPTGSKSADLEERPPKEPSRVSTSAEEPETKAPPKASSSKESLKSSGSAKAALAKVLARKDSGRESDSDADSKVRPSPSQVALLRGDISRENSNKELKSILKNSSVLKNREGSQKSLDGADSVAAGDTGDTDATGPQKKATFIIGGDMEEDEETATVFDLVKTAEAQASEAQDRIKRFSPLSGAGQEGSVPTPMDRLRIGSMTKMDAEIYHKMPTEHEEAQQLLTPDLNEMISHRLEDVPGRRRHRIKKPNVSSMVYIGKQSKPQKKISVEAKKTWDKSPHEVLVELDTLHASGEGEQQEMVWCESARWIKFEEDVQQGAERWGKPHVSSLSFHSLLELRKGLEQAQE